MKKSIKYLLCSAIAVLTAVGAFAQDAPARQHGNRKDGEEWKEKFQNEKIAFLTSEIDLTVEEAQLFWPVYNEVQKSKRDAFKDVTAAFEALRQAISEGKTGKEIDVLLTAYLNAKEDTESIDRLSIEKYKKIIPEEKIAKLILGEEKFRHQQIRRLNRGGPQDGQQGQRDGNGNFRGGNRGGNRSGNFSGNRGGWGQMNMEQD
ncbi:MAG: hypothetical protein IJL56_04545 [Bacteroidales bacterium]|nr:hypothetical protein [Bacteroidales bacterium]